MLNFSVGIDTSLSATGIVVLDDKGKIFNQTILSSKLKGVERLVDLEKKLTEFMSSYSPPKMINVFIENYSFGSRIGQAFSIGEWGGVCKTCLCKMGFKYTDISPPSLKKFIAGKGNAKKEQMLLQTYKYYGIEFKDNNLCDAFGLAIMCYKFHNKVKLLKYEEEAVAKIKEALKT